MQNNQSKTALKENRTQPKQQEKKRRFPLKEVLISLGISLILLGAIVGVSVWYQRIRNVIFDPLTVILCDAVGFVIMFFIVFHFVKKPADTSY